MEPISLVALFIIVLGYAHKLKEKPAPEGFLSIMLQAGLVAMGLTILKLFWR